MQRRNGGKKKPEKPEKKKVAPGKAAPKKAAAARPPARAKPAGAGKGEPARTDPVAPRPAPVAAETPGQALGEIAKQSGSITPEERRRMIAEAASYRAARRGFAGGEQHRDWVEAEAEIDAKLREQEQQG